MISSARWAPSALAAAMIAGTGLSSVVADHPHLTRDSGLTVLAPVDGTRVGSQFLIAWAPGRHSSLRFALFVDQAPVPPGRLVTPGGHAMLVAGTAVRMTLGPRVGGSPTARHWHTVVVVPVDANGYRIGENSAAVHVRDSS